MLTIRGERGMIAGFTGLAQTGVLTALDGDRAGRDSIVRAYELLPPHTAKTMAAIMPEGSDPAQLLQAQGPAR